MINNIELKKKLKRLAFLEKQEERRKAKMRAYYKNILSKSPEYKAKMRAYQQSPEYKIKLGMKPCESCGEISRLRKASVDNKIVQLCTRCLHL